MQGSISTNVTTISNFQRYCFLSTGFQLENMLIFHYYFTYKTNRCWQFCRAQFTRMSPQFQFFKLIINFLSTGFQLEITVFLHIVAAATILFWIHLLRKLFKFLFPLCNENLNSFLTRWGNYSRRGNYSREETKWGNTVSSLMY